MSAIVYLSLEQAIDIHDRTISISGGGERGSLDVGSLESVLTHIKNDDYYPSFASKLSHLFFGACRFHSFQDGNKRIAITLCAQMLLLNGYLYCSSHFIRSMENVSYHVASGAISPSLLEDIMRAVLDDDLESESLKLRIFTAINT